MNAKDILKSRLRILNTHPELTTSLEINDNTTTNTNTDSNDNTTINTNKAKTTVTKCERSEPATKCEHSERSERSEPCEPVTKCERSVKNYKILTKDMWKHRDIYDKNTLHLNCFEGMLSFNVNDGAFWKEYGKHVIGNRDIQKHNMQPNAKWKEYLKLLLESPACAAKQIIKHYINNKKQLSHIDYNNDTEHYKIVSKDINSYFKDYLLSNASTRIEINILRKMIKNREKINLWIYVNDPMKENPAKAIIDTLFTENK